MKRTEEDMKRRVMELAGDCEASIRELHALLEGFRCKSSAYGTKRAAKQPPDV